MKTKNYLFILASFTSIVSSAQINVGSNTAPNADAMIEVSGNTKGLLFPRVALSSTSSFAPLSAHVAGMTVYNTATAGSGSTAVTPGIYFNTGSTWMKISTGNGSSWLLGGNSNGSINTIGTNDNYDFPVKTNNVERMRVTSTGTIGIGTTVPAAQVDIAAGTTSFNNIVNATGSINDYLEINIQNTNTGTHAQSGFSSTADNGSATTGFAWLGINNSTFNYPTTYNIGGPNDVSFLGSGQDLYLANANQSKSIIFSTGKSSSPYFNERMRITNLGYVGIGTSSPVAKLDVATGATAVNSIVNATGSINDYLQFNIQNTSSGVQAQSGYSATANNGSATTGFAWLGINNSTFNFPTAYNVGGANDVSFLGSGQDLYIANANNTKSIIFSTGKAVSPYFNENMRITNSGFVGIGTTSPLAKLDLTGVKSTGAGNGTGASNDGASQAIIPAGNNGTGRMNDWPSGWGGGLSTYDVCGAGTFFNSYVTRSDSTLKKNIKSINDEVNENFLKLRPVTYLMKEESKEMEGTQFGFIAQEVRELFPSLVTQNSDPNGVIGMNYQGLIAPTIYIVQEQNEKIKLLEATNKELEEQLKIIVDRLNKLEDK